MMTIEFHTQIDNDTIVIPEEFREQMKGTARVTVVLEDEEKKPSEDFIQFLMLNPLSIPDFKPLTRDEIYDRN